MADMTTPALEALIAELEYAVLGVPFAGNLDRVKKAKEALRAHLSAPPEGWVMVPVEPTAEIIAAAAIAVWPSASAADIELARRAAPLVLMQSDLGPSFSVDSLAAALATMAPAYRAMIAARPTRDGGEAC